ncbi:hypothetical protein DM01DRAFT_1292399 [Hesseltinella vesiculosa]|uniref:Uncharacterized protein n=1 Tax=Hesseltinella vesiculosa TaxID=101127 RepID=A0A1X2G8V5_9FUNG|nr:hypothetical protein DM01DRAFT_1292399 [Hesseltinella vesiculosa]
MSTPCKQLLGLIHDIPPSATLIRNILRKSTLGEEPFDTIVHADLHFTEVIMTHFPRNPLLQRSLERTAATFTTVSIINNLFLSNNDVIDLSWFEKEVQTTGSTKWDGVVFAIKNKRVTPVLIEFSGDNRIHFEAIILLGNGVFIKRNLFVVTCPTSPDELKDFGEMIPSMLAWKKAVVEQTKKLSKSLGNC